MTYGGDLSPEQCWNLMESESNSILIDVRTNAEWAYVGMPLLAQGMNPVIGQQWQVFPDMTVDQGFADALINKLDQMGADKDANLCFLCRSGVRSLAAAQCMTQNGYPNTFNVTGGFEGDLNSNRQRGNTNGWKAVGLPWHQG